ncbi:MAG TPA: hypothetical protein VN999_05180 [Thermoanaerobaculia bacterium]|nr:hypothetical protein [Thermoanaerobaculia bacterium]
MMSKRLLKSTLPIVRVVFSLAVCLAGTGCDPAYRCLPNGWERDGDGYKLGLPAVGVELKTLALSGLIFSSSVGHTFDIDNRGDSPVVLERAELILKSHIYDAHVEQPSGEPPMVGPGTSRSIYLYWRTSQDLDTVFDEHLRIVMHFKVEGKRSVVELACTCSVGALGRYLMGTSKPPGKTGAAGTVR